jgi:SNF2 family DNA or RNA helicase
LYAEIKVINPDDEMFQKLKSYTAFLHHYFLFEGYFKPRLVWAPEGYYRFISYHYKPIGLLRPEFKQELKEWFEKYAYIVKREDAVELPPLQEITVELKKVRLEHDISNYDLANFIKKYQTSSLTKEKLEYVLDFIEENPNTIVFSLFVDFVKMLQDKLKNKAYFITGSTPAEYRMQVIERQDKPIISTYVMSEGANLQRGYKNIVFASLPLKYIELEQAIGRVYRAGQDKKVALYYLLQNDIDKTVLNILKRKQNVVEYLRG